MMPSKVVEGKLPCPSCTSSDAYYLYDDGHGYCYSCNYFKPAKEEALQEFTYEYLPRRGINRETLVFFDAKTKIDQDGKPVSIGYKYPNGDIKVRLLDKKEFFWVKNPENTEGEPAGLYGRDRYAAGGKCVTITEGEEDAHSLRQVLHGVVVSVQSASTAVRDCTVDRSWLGSFESVYLAFDDDGPGHDATRDVAKLFDYNKVHVLRFAPRKDANEYLGANEVDELRTIWHNAQKYLPETVISSFADFRKILQEPLERGVPYPFPTLNDMTYGIRKGEVVLLTAQEGVGKTEIMHAIEHKLLQETDDAVGAIFLEEPKQRHLLAVAGCQLRRPIHLPDYGCSTDQAISAIEETVRRDGRLHLYSHFGSDDPSVLLDTIRFLVSARSCVYVLLDHITMVVSGLAGEDERRALDYISTQLAMMVKGLGFALIIVSHVNDEGLTRGSRYISKIADIRIDAKRDLLNSNPVVRNTTSLTISKNRFCGRTGPAGEILFDPETYTFKEMGHAQAANDNSRDSQLALCG